MTQLFNVSIDSTDVTEETAGCTISEEINIFYDIATVTMKHTTDQLIEKYVVINYGCY